MSKIIAPEQIVADSLGLVGAVGTDSECRLLTSEEVADFLSLGSAAYSNSGDFAAAAHSHVISDVTGLASSLAGLASDIATLATTTVPTSRTLTINGTTYDLSANRSWTVTQDLSGYVPYTGASGNVNLGSNSLTAGAVVSSNSIGSSSVISGMTGIDFTTANVLLFRQGGTRWFGLRDTVGALFSNAGGIGFAANGASVAFTSAWYEDAANTIAQRNSTNAQQFNLYGTYTSATSREYLKFRGVASSNFEIGPANGSAGGTLRGLTLGGYTNDASTITPWLTFTNAGAATFASTVACTSVTTGYGTGLILGDSYTTLSAGSGQITVRALNVNMWLFSSAYTRAKSDCVIGWSSGAVSAAMDTGIARNAAGTVEINTGTAGTYGSLTACNYTANAGTITTSKPYSVTQTWNSGATTFSLFDASITPTAAATGSNWINFASTTMWGGNNYPTFSASVYSGVLTICGIWGDATLVLGGPSIGARIVPVYGTGLRISPQGAGAYTFRIGTHGAFGSNTQFENWNVANSLVFTGTGFSSAIAWDASNVYSQRNGENAQTWRLENTFTSTTNREYFQQSWVSNELRMGTAVGSAGGTQRSTVIGSWNIAGTWNPSLVIGVPGGSYASAHVIEQSSNTIRGFYCDQYSGDTAGSVAVWRKARGTLASPSAVQNLDALGSFTFRGYTSSGSFASVSSCYILVRATENFTATALGGQFEFGTIANGSASSAVRLIISDAGLTISDAHNLVLGTSSGTKIGTSTSQKLGLWNATPIIQPTTGVASATRTGGGGTALTDTDTYDGYTIAQVVKALRNMGALA